MEVINERFPASLPIGPLEADWGDVMRHFHRSMQKVAQCFGLAASALSGVARAEYGAIAQGHDAACASAALKLYIQLNAVTQARADQAALAGCQELGGTACRIVIRFGKGRCAYINVTPSHSCDATAAAWASTAQQAHNSCVAEAKHIGAPYPCPPAVGGCNR
jgi:hypothetical protein